MMSIVFMGMVAHVLVPVDDSEPARKAFEYALETFPDATISVMHVIDPSDIFHFADADLESRDVQDFDEFQEQREETVNRMLEDYVSKGEAQGVTVESVKEVGQPERRILQFAETGDVDHIVIGSHGRSGVSRILLGSIAESVARRAPTPTTIIR